MSNNLIIKYVDPMSEEDLLNQENRSIEYLTFEEIFKKFGDLLTEGELKLIKLYINRGS